MRIYSCVVTPHCMRRGNWRTRSSTGRLEQSGFFSCREVYLKGWSGLDSPEAVKQAAEVLEDAGWVRDLPPHRDPSVGGRPTGTQ